MHAMNPSGRLAAAALVAVLASVGGAVAQSGSKQPEMTAEQKAAMEAWTKAATPGAAHKLLDPTIGVWGVAMTTWDAPGAPPTKSVGTAENEWVLGGRFVRQSYHGDFMGMKFEGLGYTGYDNVAKQYIGTWMDSMGTAMMVSTGTADASGKVITMRATIDDATTTRKIAVREVLRIVDANRHEFEMYGTDPSGKETEMMEAVYTRK